MHQRGSQQCTTNVRGSAQPTFAVHDLNRMQGFDVFPGVRRAAAGSRRRQDTWRLGRASLCSSSSRSRFCGRPASGSAGGSGAARCRSSGFCTCNGSAARRCCSRRSAWRPSCCRCCCCHRCRCSSGQRKRLGSGAHRAAAGAAARPAAAAETEGVSAGHPAASRERRNFAIQAQQCTPQACEHTCTASLPSHQLHPCRGLAGHRQPPQPSTCGKGVGSGRRTDQDAERGFTWCWQRHGRCVCWAQWRCRFQGCPSQVLLPPVACGFLKHMLHPNAAFSGVSRVACCSSHPSPLARTL